MATILPDQTTQNDPDPNATRRNKKRARPALAWRTPIIIPAVTYSPTQLPMQYYRR